MGSLTPHLPPCGVARLRGFEHGRHRAPPESRLLQGGLSKHFRRGVKLIRYWTERQRLRGLNELNGGTVLPNFRSPTPFPL